MPSRKLYRLLLDFCSEKAYSLLGRRERSKKEKFLPLAFSNYTPFLHKTQGASVNFSFGGRIAKAESIAPQGALLKKASYSITSPVSGSIFICDFCRECLIDLMYVLKKIVCVLATS